MVEVKKSRNEDALFKQLHFILGIWSPVKAFTDLYCFLAFTVDLTFGKILIYGRGRVIVLVGELATHVAIALLRKFSFNFWRYLNLISYCLSCQKCKNLGLDPEKAYQ